MTAPGAERVEERASTTRCRGCGARYRVSYALTPVHVVDAFNCQFCRREVSSWSGFLAPRHSLIQGEGSEAGRLRQGQPDRLAAGGKPHASAHGPPRS